jgi:hypothetical protein
MALSTRRCLAIHCGEIRIATEDISVSGDQLSLTIVCVFECPESIDLQFKDELVGIERLDAAGKPDGARFRGSIEARIAVQMSEIAVTQLSGFCCACELRSAKRPSRVVKERNSGIRLRRVKAAQGSASDAHGVSDILAAAVGPATSPR